MRVTGSGSPLPPSASRRAGAGSGGFGVASSDSARSAAAPARASALSGVGSLDALLALQDVEGPTERRRRAMNRAGRILDVLEEVKLSLLEGGLDSGPLHRLGDAVRAERAQTQDTRLEGVLDEIETRAAVELAKREFARAA